ncbi:MAG: hypothetical protein MN733_07705 [Nitrososphaera sp.]|nr:hypothetical protein [Nitrososphaera sp.]
MRKNTLNDLAKIAKQAADEYPAFERHMLNELNSHKAKLNTSTKDTTTTELLQQAERDIANQVLRKDAAKYHIRIAKEYFDAESGKPESEWSPIAIKMIQHCLVMAYRN